MQQGRKDHPDSLALLDRRDQPATLERLDRQGSLALLDPKEIREFKVPPDQLDSPDSPDLQGHKVTSASLALLDRKDQPDSLVLLDRKDQPVMLERPGRSDSLALLDPKEFRVFKGPPDLSE